MAGGGGVAPQGFRACITAAPIAVARSVGVQEGHLAAAGTHPAVRSASLDLPSLSLGATAPHAVTLIVGECVFEALGLHRASVTDPLGFGVVDSLTLASRWEPQLGWFSDARCPCLPVGHVSRASSAAAAASCVGDGPGGFVRVGLTVPTPG